MWGEFDPVGRWFGPYRVVQAGWARILYAHDSFLNRYVAVVLLQPPPGVEHRDFLFRLERETRILRDLEHPNILPVYDCGYAHEHFYMVTALPTAETLSARLKEGPLPLREAGPILHRIASAMDAIHREQLFHGDIKPANILIDGRDNHVQLTRFGISHFGHAGVVGTLLYMAPELLDGNPIDAHAEIYSLGVLAFEILSGRCPFESMPSLAAAHRNGVQAPRLHTLCPNVPRWVSVAVDKALCRDRAARFATAVEFANAAWPDRDSQNVEPR